MIHLGNISDILKNFGQIGVFKATLEIGDYSVFKENEHLVKKYYTDMYVEVDSKMPSFGIEKDLFKILIVHRATKFKEP